MTLKVFIFALVAGLVSWLVLGCGKCEKFNSQKFSCENSDNNNNAASSCPDPNNTTINGVENQKSTTLDKAGRWNSQVHLETMNRIQGYHHVSWKVGMDRQTCASGYVSESSGYQQYLQITASPGTVAMRVVPGKNYIDYTVNGCKTEKDTLCTDIVETGTIVLDVNYVP